jgi:hypothetical protein
MYCSHCGSRTEDLNFCKNCGARNERNSVSDDGRLKGLAMSAAAFIGVFGLVGFYFVMRELLRSPTMTPAAVFLILMAYLVATIVMFGIFLRMARPDRTSTTMRPTPTHPVEHGYLRPVTTAQLEEPREMPASVTEHTTRTLDEVRLRDR